MRNLYHFIFLGVLLSAGCSKSSLTNSNNNTPPGPQTTVTTFAGSSAGYIDAQGTAAQFSHPSSLVIDGLGNLFVVDAGNSFIRKIDPVGNVSTFTSTAQYVKIPNQIAIDGSGNIYITPSLGTVNPRIVKFTAAGIETTYPFDFNYNDSPLGIVSNQAGTLYEAAYTAKSVRKVLPDDTSSFFSNVAIPSAIGIDLSGNIYILSEVNLTTAIYKITPLGAATKYPGSPVIVGIGTDNGEMAVDAAGNVYIADTDGDMIKKVSRDGTTTLLAGEQGTAGHKDGAGLSAQFDQPNGIAIDAAGNLYVTEAGNNDVRKITFN